MALAALDVADHQVGAAKQRIESLARSHPDHVQMLLALAGLETDRQRLAALYRRVLEASPKNLVVLNNLAYLLAGEDPDAAISLAEEAIALAPNDPTVQDTVGWAYYQKGVYAVAVRYLEPAVSNAPTPQRQFHLGMAYLKLGQAGRGTALIADALAKDSRLAGSNLGDVR